MIVKIVIVGVVCVLVSAAGAIAKNNVPLREPPGPGKRLLIYLSKNVAQTRSDHELPELRPRSYPVPAEELFGRVKEAIAELEWKVIESEPERFRVHAVATTPWLRFKDDIHVALEESAPNETILNVTSRSRIGRADYGANIGHVLQLQKTLDMNS